MSVEIDWHASDGNKRCWNPASLLERQLTHRKPPAEGATASAGTEATRARIVDATIIGAPSSTKNAEKARDPEMRQTKKGQQWYRHEDAHQGGQPHRADATQW